MAPLSDWRTSPDTLRPRHWRLPLVTVWSLPVGVLPFACSWRLYSPTDLPVPACLDAVSLPAWHTFPSSCHHSFRPLAWSTCLATRGSLNRHCSAIPSMDQLA